MGVPDNTDTGTVCSGHTTPGSTNWIQYDVNGIYVDVSTSACGLTAPPLYLTSFGGTTSHYVTNGATSIYQPTATGFRIYINQSGITPAIANSRSWHINWLAVTPNAHVGAGVRKYYSAGGSRVALREDGLLRLLLSDHLGSTSITTDSSGNKLSELRFKAWGETRYTWGVTPTDYTYTGQYSNVDDFGLMYYGARWYDPALSRFTSADTVTPGGTQGLDRYHYASNNPIMYNDPSGHDPCSSIPDPAGQEACAEGIEQTNQEPTFVEPTESQYETHEDTDNNPKTPDVCTGCYEHHGYAVDYAIVVGEEVFASAWGTVVVADLCATDCQNSGHYKDNNNGYGSMVIIEYKAYNLPWKVRDELKLKPGDSAYFLFGHLSQVDVKAGDMVIPGQQVGLTGNSGNSTGPHLHMELRTGSTGMEPGLFCGGDTTACTGGVKASWYDLPNQNPEDMHDLYQDN